MEKVTIIVPVYNAEKYIKRSVDSIVNQTYQNLEIILVNDGSTDGSAEILDEYAKNDQRIKVVHKNNEGASITRNCGIEKATGDYLLFVDSDDYINADLVETVVKINEKQKADAVIFGYDMVGANGDLIYRYKPYTVDGEYEYFNDNEMAIYKTLSSLSKEYMPYSVWCTLFKTSVIKENKVLFDNPDVVYAEDWRFNVLFMANAKKIYVIDKNFYNYVQLSSTLSSNVNTVTKRIREVEKMAYSLKDGVGGKVVLEKYNEYFPFLYYSISRAHLVTAIKTDGYNLYKYIEKMQDSARFYNLVDTVWQNAEKYKPFFDKKEYKAFCKEIKYVLRCKKVFYRIKFSISRFFKKVAELIKKAFRKLKIVIGK